MPGTSETPITLRCRALQVVVINTPIFGGEREFAPVLARAAAAVGVAALFIETHQDPDNANTAEGPTMVPLRALPVLLETLVAFDHLAKARPMSAI